MNALFSVDGWNLPTKIKPGLKKQKKKSNKDKADLAHTPNPTDLTAISRTEVADKVEKVEKNNNNNKKDNKRDNKDFTKDKKRGRQDDNSVQKKDAPTRTAEQIEAERIAANELDSQNGERVNIKKPKVYNTVTAPAPIVPGPAPSGAKLTPLQLKMREKLMGSRFRWINEQLYTISSESALELIKNSPDIFDEYHSGFRSQVQAWPENPVDTFVGQLQQRLERPIGAPGGLPGDRDGTIIIADMGCGEAQLASDINRMTKAGEFKPAGAAKAANGKKGKAARPAPGSNAGKPAQNFKNPKFTVHSFDLKKANDFITVADIANVPLPDQSCHIVIFCLSLMGTNFLDFINEAMRILKPNGELWISEIKSRFTDPEAKDFVSVLKQIGFFHKNTDTSNKMFIRFEFFRATKEMMEQKLRREQQKRSRFADKEDNNNNPRSNSYLDRRSAAPEGQWLLKPCIYKRR